MHSLFFIFPFFCGIFAASVYPGVTNGFRTSPAVRRNVSVGKVIEACNTPGTIALTFDDGPSEYTEAILDLLEAAGAKGTFFVNGQNVGNIYDDGTILNRMVKGGHQIGSHTWSHADLTTVSRDKMLSEMQSLEKALDSLIGMHPTYMRPPYFSYNDDVLGVMKELGYHVINADIDTKDYLHDDPKLINKSVVTFESELNAGGSIVLSHDIYEQTADTLVQDMLNDILNKSLSAVTVGKCLGDDPGNWYI